ncbi:pesticin C-terminus-like muramidase [Xanthomonas hortorum]|uniref:pesticin C-terminus-like muramidase n=1 Tax=Xanthomonas hortorum TaxID=56454 RepID=UPI000A033BB5
MRELTNEELFLVAGAAAAADVDPSEPPTEVPPIVVHPPSDPPPTIPPSPPVEQPTPITPPGGGNGGNGFVPLAAENRIDNAFIDSVEGGQQLTAYVPTKNGVAIDRSGVTVATGVDLGSQTVESLTALGVDQALVNTLSPYLHLTTSPRPE